MRENNLEKIRYGNSPPVAAPLIETPAQPLNPQWLETPNPTRTSPNVSPFSKLLGRGKELVKNFFAKPVPVPKSMSIPFGIAGKAGGIILNAVPVAQECADLLKRRNELFNIIDQLTAKEIDSRQAVDRLKINQNLTAFDTFAIEEQGKSIVRRIDELQKQKNQIAQSALYNNESESSSEVIALTIDNDIRYLQGEYQKLYNQYQRLSSPSDEFKSAIDAVSQNQKDNQDLSYYKKELDGVNFNIGLLKCGVF